MTALDDGVYTFLSLYNGFPLVFDNGDRVSIYLYRALYGGTSGLTLSDAQNTVRNATSHLKLKVKVSLFSPANTTYSFVAP